MPEDIQNYLAHEVIKPRTYEGLGTGSLSNAEAQSVGPEGTSPYKDGL